MTEMEMMKELEKGRQYSEKYNCIVKVVGNGSCVVWYDGNTAECNKNYFENSGYWTVAIFENGHRVEA